MAQQRERSRCMIIVHVKDSIALDFPQNLFVEGKLHKQQIFVAIL